MAALTPSSPEYKKALQDMKDIMGNQVQEVLQKYSSGTVGSPMSHVSKYVDITPDEVTVRGHKFLLPPTGQARGWVTMILGLYALKNPEVDKILRLANFSWSAADQPFRLPEEKPQEKVSEEPESEPEKESRLQKNIITDFSGSNLERGDVVEVTDKDGGNYLAIVDSRQEDGYRIQPIFFDSDLLSVRFDAVYLLGTASDLQKLLSEFLKKKP